MEIDPSGELQRCARSDPPREQADAAVGRAEPAAVLSEQQGSREHAGEGEKAGRRRATEGLRRRCSRW